MRDAFTFLVPLGRRKPFTLTAPGPTKGQISLVCPVEGKRVRMPVQGPFRAAVLALVDIGAIAVPDGGSVPPEAVAEAEKSG